MNLLWIVAMAAIASMLGIASCAQPPDAVTHLPEAQAPKITPILPTAAPTPTATPVPPTAVPTPTATPVPPTAVPTPTATPVPPTAVPTPTATPVPPTAVPTPTATPVPTATPTVEETILNTISPAPRAMGYADWGWDNTQSFKEIKYTFDFHNDVEFGGRNGLYLIACTAFTIGTNDAYFGLQTDVNTGPAGDWRNIGKGAIFSVWDVPSDDGVRAPADSWIEKGDYEGDFLSVRRAYRWQEGQYVLSVSQEETDTSGTWYAMHVNGTWIGSLRFARGARIQPFCGTTIEVYGSPVRASDIPYWRVSMEPPIADGIPATLVDVFYPEEVGTLRNALISTDGNHVTMEVGLDYLAH